MHKFVLNDNVKSISWKIFEALYMFITLQRRKKNSGYNISAVLFLTCFMYIHVHNHVLLNSSLCKDLKYAYFSCLCVYFWETWGSLQDFSINLLSWMILFLYERKSCHRNVQDGKKISYLKHKNQQAINKIQKYNSYRVILHVTTTIKQESRLLEHDTCIVGSRVLVDGSTHPFSDSLLLLQVLNLIFTILHSKKVIDTMHPFLEKLGVKY